MLRSAMHAVGAGIFFFVVQRFVLNQPQHDSIVYAVAFALAAAGLAWYQSSPKR